MAAERRLASLQGEGERISLCGSVTAEPIRTAPMTPTQGPEEDESDGTDVEELRETDGDRRLTMMTSMDATEADRLRTGTLTDFWGDFILPKRTTGEGCSTGNKEIGDNGSPRGTLQIAGNTSVATSATSAPVRTRADPISTKFTPAQEFQHEEQDALGNVVAEPHNTLDSTTPNSNQNLKVRNKLRTIREDKQILPWSCLLCTL